jgi:hypothetical protein
MISSKNKCVFIFHLNNLTLEIIFDVWWVSINEGSKRPIGWNDSTHAPSWRFTFHCRFEETGIPGIICIVCHQVLCHPAEYGTSSMRKHWLAKAYIAKLNEITESEAIELISLMIHDAALAILKMQGSREITIVSSQRQIIFDSG